MSLCAQIMVQLIGLPHFFLRTRKMCVCTVYLLRYTSCASDTIFQCKKISNELSSFFFAYIFWMCKSEFERFTVFSNLSMTATSYYFRLFGYLWNINNQMMYNVKVFLQPFQRFVHADANTSAMAAATSPKNFSNDEENKQKHNEKWKSSVVKK